MALWRHMSLRRATILFSTPVVVLALRMLTGVAKELGIGGSISLALTFEQAGVVQVKAEANGG